MRENNESKPNLANINEIPAAINGAAIMKTRRASCKFMRLRAIAMTSAEIDIIANARSVTPTKCLLEDNYPLASIT